MIDEDSSCNFDGSIYVIGCLNTFDISGEICGFGILGFESNSLDEKKQHSSRPFWLIDDDDPV